MLNFSKNLKWSLKPQTRLTEWRCPLGPKQWRYNPQQAMYHVLHLTWTTGGFFCWCLFLVNSNHCPSLKTNWKVQYHGLVRLMAWSKKKSKNFLKFISFRNCFVNFLILNCTGRDDRVTFGWSIWLILHFTFRTLFLGKAKCVLNCATTEGDTTTFGNVKDGTPCTDKPDSGICINGLCEVTIL